MIRLKIRFGEWGRVPRQALLDANVKFLSQCPKGSRCSTSISWANDQIKPASTGLEPTGSGNVSPRIREYFCLLLKSWEVRAYSGEPQRWQRILQRWPSQRGSCASGCGWCLTVGIKHRSRKGWILSESAWLWARGGKSQAKKKIKLPVVVAWIHVWSLATGPLGKWRPEASVKHLCTGRENISQSNGAGEESMLTDQGISHMISHYVKFKKKNLFLSKWTKRWCGKVLFRSRSCMIPSLWLWGLDLFPIRPYITQCWAGRWGPMNPLNIHTRN